MPNEAPEKNENEQPTNAEYIEAISEIKRNSVPKTDYEKLLEEKKQLVKALVEGGQMANPDPDADKTSDELAKEMCAGNLPNLEYVKLSLEHRRRCLDEGKPDPYVPRGLNFQDSRQTDASDAQSVADVLRECVESCNGDSELFTNLLQTRMKDLPIIRPKAQKD